MVDIKIGGPQGPARTNKSKSSTKANKAGGPSFSSLVDQASANETVEETQAVTPAAPVQNDLAGGSPYAAGEEVPTNPKDRGTYMLQKLEELEQDILTGSPTIAIERLKQALATAPQGVESLNTQQREILDEIDLRAAIEVAKMEEK